MTSSAVREKLYDYIRIADDKKIKAIYMMLEDDIAEKTEWWKNARFVADLEKNYGAWDVGKQKGYSLEAVEKSLEVLRKKRGK
jgi:hypothetical protein